VIAGAVAAAVAGPWLVLVLLACGALELAWRRRAAGRIAGVHAWAVLAAAAPAAGGLVALSWTALKVGALSYGGGFVIVPLMQGDAVEHRHWMSGAEFLDAVALGQVTPGPVTHTVAAVGFAAAGVGGALLAASFAFVLAGGRHFAALRERSGARAFLDGAGPAAAGAILGSAVPLGAALSEPWQAGVLTAAAALLFLARRGVVLTLVLAGAVGAILALAGAPTPG
jgi:chromate transporter